jgi:hypothetical protein
MALTNVGEIQESCESGMNGRKIQWGNFKFTGQDAEGELEMHMTTLESMTITANGANAPAAGDLCGCAELAAGPVAVPSTGKVTMKRTAGATADMHYSYRAIGW